MKRLLSLLLALVLALSAAAFAEGEPEFSGMNDPSLLQYIEDDLYENLVTSLDSDEYFVENVQAVYISQEYLDEIAYNSQSNVFFGFTLAELEAQFSGERYVFTLGDDGTTQVQPFEDYDDTYDRILHNIAVGTGVILICVTVSVVTGGAAPAVSMIFAMSAKTATVAGVSGGLLGGVASGIVTGIQTHDWDAALKAAALTGSESFKWGAITGAISNAAMQTIELSKARSVAWRIINNHYEDLPGYNPSKVFFNKEHLLPDDLLYLEYDVNPLVPGVSRDAKRLIFANDGSIWYTNDHYASFTKIQ